VYLHLMQFSVTTYVMQVSPTFPSLSVA